MDSFPWFWITAGVNPSLLRLFTFLPNKVLTPAVNSITSAICLTYLPFIHLLYHSLGYNGYLDVRDRYYRNYKKWWSAFGGLYAFCRNWPTTWVFSARRYIATCLWNISSQW